MMDIMPNALSAERHFYAQNYSNQGKEVKVFGAKISYLVTREKILVLDGAMGTMPQEQGLRPATVQSFCLEHPQVLEEIHGAYLDVQHNSNQHFWCQSV